MKINHDIWVIIFTAKIVNSSQDFGGNKYSKNNKYSDPLVNNKNISRDFGGNKYSKYSWIMYIINGKFWW